MLCSGNRLAALFPFLLPVYALRSGTRSVTTSLIPTSLLQVEFRRASSGHRVRSGHCQIQLQRRDITRSLIASANARSKHRRSLPIERANLNTSLYAHLTVLLSYRTMCETFSSTPSTKCVYQVRIMHICCESCHALHAGKWYRITCIHIRKTRAHMQGAIVAKYSSRTLPSSRLTS